MTRWMVSTTAPVLCLAACGGDYELEKQEQVISAVPDVALDPWTLSAGGVPLGETAVLEGFVVNRGTAVLSVSSLEVTGGTAFSVLMPEGGLPLRVPVDGRAAVSVVYTAGGDDAAVLEIGSDDPDTPVIDLSLSGHATMPRLETRPADVDLGPVVRCGEELESVSLLNVGEAPLVISAVDAVGSGWSIVEAPAWPVTLAVDESVPVVTRFSPLADGVAPGELLVDSTDPRSLVAVPLAAEGVGYAVDERLETHIQPTGPHDALDIVFFVDQSASMDVERQALGERFPELIDALDGLGLDWQAAVVTGDDGCANTGIISGSDGAAATRFIDGLHGPWGWYAEAGLTVAAAALSASGPGGCNAGLIREDALPMVVLVSDEADHSEPDWRTPTLAMAESAPGVMLHAVVGPAPTGCDLAVVGTGYLDAAEWSGGATASICDTDWDALFEDLATLAGGEPTDTFGLEAPPEPGSVSVVVDGEPVEGWTYDEELQAVVFDDLPTGGAVIEVAYTIASDCG